MNVWKDLNCSYGEDCIFEEIELRWREGEQIGFWGCSACGKTSLLKIIAKRLREEGKKIAYVFQQEVLLDWLTVEQNILLVNTKAAKGQYHKIIKLLQLEEHLLKYPQELSGGLRKRVALARAFFYEAEYLLLDEAFEFLDLGMQEIILQFLQEEQKKKKKTVFFVTHQIELMLQLAETVYCFEGEKPFRDLKRYSIQNQEEMRKKLEGIVCRI